MVVVQPCILLVERLGTEKFRIASELWWDESTAIFAWVINSCNIVGDLAIHGVTKEVVLETEYAGQAKSPWSTTSAGFSAKTEINRKAFGLDSNAALETGGMLVGDKVEIDSAMEIVKQ